MSSQDNITKRILDEARKEADSVLAEASRKADELTKAAAAETDAEVARIAREAQAKAEELRRRRLAVAEMEARKDVLAQKQALLDEAFAEALQRLSVLPDSEKEKLITPMVISAADGGEELIVTEKERAYYEKGLLKRLNDALVKAGKPGNLKLCAKRGNFSGGLVLVSNVLEKNSTFEALLRSVREESEKEIGELLFGRI